MSLKNVWQCLAFSFLGSVLLFITFFSMYMEYEQCEFHRPIIIYTHQGTGIASLDFALCIVHKKIFCYISPQFYNWISPTEVTELEEKQHKKFGPSLVELPGFKKYPFNNF